VISEQYNISAETREALDTSSFLKDDIAPLREINDSSDEKGHSKAIVGVV
jgi:hypothetical protein